MKIKCNDRLFKGKKCWFFKRDEDLFFLPLKFVKTSRKGKFFVFPAWATQISVKHKEKFYKIFLDDFEAFYLKNIPIPFYNHFPEEPQPKPVKQQRKVKKTIINAYKVDVQPFVNDSWLNPTHDEIVIAKRNGEID